MSSASASASWVCPMQPVLACQRQPPVLQPAAALLLAPGPTELAPLKHGSAGGLPVLTQLMCFSPRCPEIPALCRNLQRLCQLGRCLGAHHAGQQQGDWLSIYSCSLSGANGLVSPAARLVS